MAQRRDRTGRFSSGSRSRRASTESACLVKVAKVGSEVREFALDGERTVEAALDLAGITVGTGMRVRVNGVAATMDKTLRSGDVITVAEKVQGGM